MIHQPDCSSVTDHVITAKNLVRVFGRGEAAVTALDDVSLELPRGRWTTLMGPSGSGKTTLLHCLSGLDVPDSGQVVLHSSPGKATTISGLSENDRARLRRTRIGIIFQDFNLVPVLNVRDNIKLPMRLAHSKIDSHWFDEVTSRLGINGRLKHLPHQLSGGQRQRVAVARALLPKPDIIFADEPTGNLDSVAGSAVLDLFRQVADDFGQTLAVVTHDPEAARRGDHLVELRDGKLVTSTAGFNHQAGGHR